jgi:DNA-binding transcriptional ArsR family regulator
MRITANAEAIELKAKLFRGFSDRSRLSILEALGMEERTVGELAAEVGLSQPNCSNHLACLKECGLVIGRREGKNVHYRLSDSRVSMLLGLAEELLADVAKGVYECTRYAATSGDRS